MELGRDFLNKYDSLMGEDVELALDFTEKALKESKNPDFYAYIADCYMTLGDFNKAVKFINKGLSEGCRNESFAKSLKGEVLFYLNDYDESKKTFLELLKENPNSFFVTAYLMDINTNLGEYEDAILLGENLIKSNNLDLNDRAYLTVNIGWINLKYLNNLEEAYKYFNDALNIDSNIGRAYIGLGEYYLIKKEFKEALLNFEKAIKFDEATIDVYFGISMCYKGLNMFEDAYEYLKVVCDADNENNEYLEAKKEIETILR